MSKMLKYDEAELLFAVPTAVAPIQLFSGIKIG
jgi:hypothetical protein